LTKHFTFLTSFRAAPSLPSVRNNQKMIFLVITSSNLYST